MLTASDWTNIRHCARARREAEGLCGHWADVPFSERFNELMETEVALFCLQAKAVD
jgi:hypothetical protein